MAATLLTYPTETFKTTSADLADRPLIEAILALSSSAPEREQAAAWLAAYETSFAFGASDDEAQARADDAWQRAAARHRRLAA